MPGKKRAKSEKGGHRVSETLWRSFNFIFFFDGWENRKVEQRSSGCLASPQSRMLSAVQRPNSPGATYLWPECVCDLASALSHLQTVPPSCSSLSLLRLFLSGSVPHWGLMELTPSPFSSIPHSTAAPLCGLRTQPFLSFGVPMYYQTNKTGGAQRR